MNLKFGNELLNINKLIFYCEIIKCQKIILPNDNTAFLDKNVYDEQYNITIKVGNYYNKYNTSLNEENNPNYYELRNLDFYFYYTTYNFRLENRFNIFKNEILNIIYLKLMLIRMIYIFISEEEIYLII
jgi:hypothetical protein